MRLRYFNFVKDLSKYEGKNLRLRAIEVKKSGRKEIIASQRVILEEERQERHGHTEDGEADPVDAVAARAMAAQPLHQERQEHNRDGGDQEQVLPCHRAEQAGGEHADGRGELVSGGEQAEENHLEVRGEVLGGHDEVHRAGHLAADRLQHAGDDDDPQAPVDEVRGHKAEDGAHEQREHTEHDHAAQ